MNALSRTLVGRGRGTQRASHPGVARPAAPLGRAGQRWADGAGAVDGGGRGPRCGRVSLHDSRLHAPVHGARRVRRGRSDDQPASSRSRYLVRRRRAGGWRFDLWTVGESLRSRGAWAWGAGGDVRGQPARWADAPAGADREVARLGSLHRLRWLGRAGGADRADRLGARIGDRAADACIGVAAASARRVRRGGRDLGDVQRAPRRGVLRAGADPAQLRDALLRPGRAQLGHRGRDRPRRVRQPRVPVAARLHVQLAAGAAALRRPRGARHRRRARLRAGALRRGGHLRPDLERPPGLAAARRRRRAARAAAARGPRDVRRRLSGAGAGDLRPLHRARAARAAGREDPRDEPDDVDRRLGRRVRPFAVHGCDARLGLRRRRA